MGSRIYSQRIRSAVVAAMSLLLIFVVACGSSAPAAEPPPQVDIEDVRKAVQEAMAESAAETTSAEEIKRMVQEAVASSSQGLTAEQVDARVARVEAAVAAASSQGLTAAEVEEQVSKAVAKALAESKMDGSMEEAVAPFTLTDVAGRTVTISGSVNRVILGEARQIYIVAALQQDDPFHKIIGWRDDLRRFDADTYDKYKEIFPEVDNIAEFGSPYSGEFSVEKAIALEADVVTLNLGGLARAQEAGTIKQLAAVGIPVVVIDFRQEPLENTVPSIYLLGRLLGQEDRAEEIVDFYLQQVNQVYSRVGQAEDEKPLVFMDRAAGIESAEICCRTFGRANLGLLVERAGGINMGSSLVPGWGGDVNPEQIIVSDPDVIIGTGSNWTPYNPDGDFVSMGYFTDVEDARRELIDLAAGRPGWSELQAIQTGRYHSVWHQFYNSPYHFVVLQQFAKWFYPELFEDIDPVANFAEFHDRFLPIGYSGTFMVSAKE